jgi:hypothetical protein
MKISFILLVSFSFLNVLWGETVLQGALMLMHQEGEVIVDDYNPEITMSSDGQYRVLSGLPKISAAGENSALFSTSHGVFLEFTGIGSCSFERFEQNIVQKEDDLFSLEECRMILQMNRGQLLIDASQVAAKSFIILETPCGRVALSDGILVAKVSYNESRNRYNLSLESIAGKIRYNGNEAKPLIINEGQRLLVYGKLDALAVKLTQQTSETGSNFNSYKEKIESSNMNRFSFLEFKPYMQVLQRGEVATTLPIETDNESDTLERPIIIDFTNKSPPIMPARAFVK